jgi:gamma-glutamylcyclotransferase (GGCT)/AIG2-like uncharacterized protein YtfP
MPLMFLNGGAMSGGPLHHLLRGAPLVGTVRTAPRYRFYSVGDRFPALREHDPEITGPSNERVSESGASGSATLEGGASGAGVSVVGELYDVPWEVLRESLLPAEPVELELGVIQLEDGSGALAMIRRQAFVEPDGLLYRDISEHADWRAYLASLATSQGE